MGGAFAESEYASQIRSVRSQDADSTTLGAVGQKRTSLTMFWCPNSTAAGWPVSRNHVRTV